MKKAFFAIIGLISLISAMLLVVRFFSSPLSALLNSPTKAGVKVLSTPEGESVFINNQQVGKTPYEDATLSEAEYLIRVGSNETSWQGRIRLTAGTLTVVNRELSKDANSQAGESLTLEKGKGITAISSPSESEVEIDGKAFGTTPLTADLEVGEHTFAVSHEGYLKRSIKAYVPDKYNLTINVDLGVSETEVSSFPVATPTPTPKVVVKSTPTGFLRVRDKPSTGGVEIGRVSPGDELILLEEQASWDKIRLPDGQEGYVSKIYVEKKQ